MKIGEISVGSRWPIKRFDIRSQLDEIARYETGCQTQMTQQLHHQPCGIAARPAAKGQSLFTALDTRIHSHQIPDEALQVLVDLNEMIDGTNFLAAMFLDELPKFRAGREDFEIGDQLFRKYGIVGKGNLFRRRLDEKIEGVDRNHFRNEIDFDGEFANRFGKDEPGEIVAIGVLLPVQEVRLRKDVEGVTANRGSTMGGRGAGVLPGVRE